jgi:hypothetical protein
MDLDMNIESDGSATPFNLGCDLLPDRDSPVYATWNDKNDLVSENVLTKTREGRDQHRAKQQQDHFSAQDIAAPSNTIEISAMTTPAPMTPDDRKDLCIQQLSDLSSSLMKNLNRLTTCSLATSFIFTRSDNHTAEYLFKAIDGSSSQDNAIGNVLQSTSEFIEILQKYRETLLDDVPPAHSPPRDEERTGGNSDKSDNPEELNAEEETIRRWELLHSYKTRSRHQIFTTTPSEPPHPKRQINVPVPSTLVIVTCYISILKSFENIFSSLQRWLSVPFTSALREHLAVTVADMQINGFALDGYTHRNLQFKILVQVCQDMLDQLERAVWVESGDGEGVLVNPAFQGLLAVSLREEGWEEGDVTGIGRVRGLLGEVLETLK